MVDRRSRALAAAVLRDFIAGKITSAQLDDQYPASTADRGVHAIYVALAGYFDDFRELRLPETKVGVAEERQLARCVAFLESDVEYRWPRLRGVLGRFVRLLCRKPPDEGEASVWPFFEASEFPRGVRTNG